MYDTLIVTILYEDSSNDIPGNKEFLTNISFIFSCGSRIANYCVYCYQSPMYDALMTLETCVRQRLTIPR